MVNGLKRLFKIKPTKNKKCNIDRISTSIIQELIGRTDKKLINKINEAKRQFKKK
jgi:hypothetical protein